MREKPSVTQCVNFSQKFLLNSFLIMCVDPKHKNSFYCDILWPAQKTGAQQLCSSRPLDLQRCGAGELHEQFEVLQVGRVWKSFLFSFLTIQPSG